MIIRHFLVKKKKGGWKRSWRRPSPRLPSQRAGETLSLRPTGDSFAWAQVSTGEEGNQTEWKKSRQEETSLSRTSTVGASRRCFSSSSSSLMKPFKKASTRRVLIQSASSRNDTLSPAGCTHLYGHAGGTVKKASSSRSGFPAVLHSPWTSLRSPQT